MLKTCLIAKLVLWSDVAFDMNTATLLIVTIILKRVFHAKVLFSITYTPPSCDAIFTLTLGRNGTWEKVPKPGNMLITVKLA